MKLRHFYIKVGLFGLLLLFCIMFGVSLASSGMERIEGPQPSSKVAQAPVKATGKAVTTAVTIKPSPTPVVQATALKTKQDAVQQAAPIADHDDSLNHVGNKLGELLQFTAHHGIKLFVSLFDAVLGKG